jgi:hypothetical protein
MLERELGARGAALRQRMGDLAAFLALIKIDRVRLERRERDDFEGLFLRRRQD